MSIRTLPLIALGLVCSLQLFAQKNSKIEVGLQLGLTEFLGDLGGGPEEGRPFILDTDWRFSRPLVGIYAKKHFNSRFAASGNLNFTMLKGSDSATTNPGRSARGLEFTSNVFELYGLMHFQAFDFGKLGLHANLGAGAFAYNPQTNTENPIESTRSNKIQAMFPMGIGMSYMLDKNIVLGVDIIHRVTLTDDIDGYIFEGTDNNDSYYSLNVKVGYVFGGGGRGMGKGNEFGCPSQSF